MSNIKISSQYLKSLSFTSPSVPEIFTKPASKPNIEIAIDLDAKKMGEDLYETSLKITANADNGKLFICEVNYSGIFTITNIESEMLEQILLVYCPNLLFPFVRRIISDVTISGGFPPLLLDPIDFTALYQKRKKAN